jgi:hypothetical protein
VGLVLAAFFVILNLVMRLSSLSELRKWLRDLFKKQNPDQYSFVFVALCFLGFSIWESLLYFLFAQTWAEFPRIVLASLLAMAVTYANFLRKEKDNSNLTFAWLVKNDGRLISLGGLSWVFFLGSWVSGLIFAPWLYFRWNKLTKKVR